MGINSCGSAEGRRAEGIIVTQDKADRRLAAHFPESEFRLRTEFKEDGRQNNLIVCIDVLVMTEIKICMAVICRSVFPGTAVMKRMTMNDNFTAFRNMNMQKSETTQN